jgi:hypothetical protein
LQVSRTTAAISIGAALSLGYLGWSQSEHEMVLPDAGLSNGRLTTAAELQRSVAAPVPNAPTPSASHQAHRTFRANELRGVISGGGGNGFTSRDPYPVVAALRQANRHGTFAASYELRLACVDGLVAIGGPPNRWVAPSPEADPHLQLRFAAKQEIEIRCARFSGQDSHDLALPLPGDESGIRYKKALDTLAGSLSGVLAKPTREALSEIASQGQLARFWPELQESKFWRGVSWRENAPDYELAVALASQQAQVKAGTEATDLRTLVGCYKGGDCVTGPTAFLAKIPTERRFTVEALARDMTKAFLDGDIAAWDRPDGAAK